MKKYICGLITGILIATSFTAFAAGLNIIKNDKPIYINGEKVNVSAYAIDGSTYLKLRDFEKAGLKINYDSATKHIEIENPALTAEITTKEDNTVDTTLTKPTSTPDGITQIDEYQGKYYIGIYDAKQKCEAKGYSIQFSAKNKAWQVIKNGSVILDNVETFHIFDGTEIEYNYYVSTIIPLLK